MLATIIIATFIVVFYIFLSVSIFMAEPHIFLTILLLVFIIYLIFMMIKVAIERIQEIKEEKNDDISKY